MKDTITEQIKEICNAKKGEVCLTFHSSKNPPLKVTYEELLKRSQEYASYLKKHFERKSTVIILLNVGPDLFYAFIGSIFAGLIPSIFPINPTKQDKDLFKKSMETLINFCEAQVIVTSKEHLPLLQSLNIRAKCLEPSEIKSVRDFDPPSADPDEIAFLQHSSGTTGLKKGVALTHRQVLTHIGKLSKAFQLTPQDRIASWVPLYHDLGLIAAVILPLLTGIPVEMMDTFDWVANPHLFLNVISKTKATITFQPNFAYIFLAERVQDKKIPDLDLRSLRAIINAGEPISDLAHNKFYQRFAPFGFDKNCFCSLYGMAENVLGLTVGGFSKPLKTFTVNKDLYFKNYQLEESSIGKTFVSCGQVLENAQVKIVSETGQTLPEGTIGEIYLKSDWLFKEYYHRPVETQNAFFDGWYKSGDLGFFIKDDLYVIGRKNDMMIIAGKNIYPQDIEEIISSIPGVYQGRVSVFGYDNETKGTQEMIILIEPQTDQEQELIHLEKEIRKTVAQLSEATIDQIHFVPHMWLIKSTSGKISRTANRAKWIKENTSSV
jgi:acyl-CoA synthetase (AMP-forming)/AMP-acid ligase II